MKIVTIMIAAADENNHYWCRGWWIFAESLAILKIH